MNTLKSETQWLTNQFEAIKSKNTQIGNDVRKIKGDVDVIRQDMDEDESKVNVMFDVYR